MKNLFDTLKHNQLNFWKEQMQCTVEKNALHIAYPLLDPTGWQLSFSIYKNPTSRVYTISDNGKCISFLKDNKAYGDKVKELIIHKCEFYGFRDVNKELILETLTIPSSMQIQLFAEGLMAIYHLIYRHDETGVQINKAKRNFEAVLKHSQFKYQKNYHINGHIIKDIQVDYMIESHKKIVCKITENKTDLHNYMERWAWRFDQIKQANKDTITMMIFNPNIGKWDDYCLNIGQNTCDAFLPYNNSSDIKKFLLSA